MHASSGRLLSFLFSSSILLIFCFSNQDHHQYCCWYLRYGYFLYSASGPSDNHLYLLTGVFSPRFCLWTLGPLRFPLPMPWLQCPRHAPLVCVISLWLMNTHNLCLSQQRSQSSAHGLRKAWRKEREEKKSFFPSHWGQTRSKLFWGVLCPGMRSSYCPEAGEDGGGGGWAYTGMVRGLGEWVGEKFKFLLNHVTTTWGWDKETLW